MFNQDWNNKEEPGQSSEGFPYERTEKCSWESQQQTEPDSRGVNTSELKEGYLKINSEEEKGKAWKEWKKQISD